MGRRSFVVINIVVGILKSVIHTRIIINCLLLVIYKNVVMINHVLPMTNSVIMGVTANRVEK